MEEHNRWLHVSKFELKWKIRMIENGYIVTYPHQYYGSNSWRMMEYYCEDFNKVLEFLRRSQDVLEPPKEEKEKT